VAKDGAFARELMAKEIFDLIVADMPSAEAPGAGLLIDWLRENRPSLVKRLIWMATVVPSDGAARETNPDSCQVLQKPFKAADLLLAADALLSDGVQTAPVEG